MTDREPLEFAAKAAGLNLASWYEGGENWLMLDAEADWPRSMFSPLTDDEDAFRLAARLRLQVSFGTFKDNEAVAYSFLKPPIIELAGDMTNASRRAIVRAAATMGQDIK